jgi:hypothetical protein
MKMLLPLILLGLVACAERQAERPSAASAETEPPRETVFDPLTSTIDRAEGVQDTVDAQSEELRRRIEEAEQ